MTTEPDDHREQHHQEEEREVQEVAMDVLHVSGKPLRPSTLSWAHPPHRPAESGPERLVVCPAIV